MKKVIIRRDMVTKAIEKAVDDAIEGADFNVHTKVVEVIRVNGIGERIINAALDYAKEKGVKAEVKYWGHGGAEVRYGDACGPDMGDWNDPSSRHHY